ncbi:uncharacterized protein LOC114364731 [Ostrinia furnacalis]|uniref:uncharacterized protein LOC114364731 n=1 Tax=Ostrinia furnacalis TaxID=93504 RepID=UPI00103FDF94|nr:uncharacterized protein LOC114364731 [Ostrinia furnacalis]
MDDNAKNASSYHLDQEVLDARGIGMTVEEVAGLPTTKYSERVQSLRLCDEDLAFLKGLRRRIKNRLASQNSRRRSMEQLRRLTRELRAVRACRDDALVERATLARQRDEARARCKRLRDHLIQVLTDRLDNSKVPEIDVETTESQRKPKEEKDTASCPLTPACDIEIDKNIFECRIDKLVQKSVNHIFNKNDKKKIFAKTVFLTDDKEKNSNSNAPLNFKIQNSNSKLQSNVTFHNSNVKSVVFEGLNCSVDTTEVLNLSVKEGRRKSHGRKQSAPRRITYVEYEVGPDVVLDLKIKKEPQ